MMEEVMARAEAIGRAARRERLERIAGAIREQGYNPRVEADRVAWRGKSLVQQWLGDPLLRFVGMTGR
jgi:hypothetical protein